MPCRTPLSALSVLLPIAAILCVPGLAVAQDAKPAQAAPAKAAELPDAPPIKPCAAKVKGMSCVPGGPFTRGHNRRARHARPAARVWVQTFYMDQYEVTNGEYRACIKAGKCDKAGPRYHGYADKKRAVTGISWYQAVKFCEAHGKRLATEAEWEKAARGPDGDMYPWGNKRVTCKRAVIKNRKGRSCGVKKPGRLPEKGRIAKVGSRPAGRYGLYDMIGNAQEWVQDVYTPSWKACGKDCQGVNPKGPCGGAAKCEGHKPKRVLRGGSWYWPASHATGIHRRGENASNRPFHHFGFRCAASVSQAEALAAQQQQK